MLALLSQLPISLDALWAQKRSLGGGSERPLRCGSRLRQEDIYELLNGRPGFYGAEEPVTVWVLEFLMLLAPWTHSDVPSHLSRCWHIL